MKINYKLELTKSIYIISLVAALILSSCDSEKKSTKLNFAPSLTVLVYDISISNDEYSILKLEHIERLLNNIGKNGGGIIYGLFIKTNSLKQDPLVINVPAIELLPLKGNAYQIANRKDYNDKLNNEFNEIRKTLLTNANSLLVPKSEKFSDLENALKIAKQIFENPVYKNWNKQICIISDMIYDRPPVNGPDEMEPIRFSKDILIKVVRPDYNIDITNLLPGARIIKYVTIDDAIESMGINVKEGYTYAK